MYMYVRNHGMIARRSMRYRQSHGHRTDRSPRIAPRLRDETTTGRDQEAWKGLGGKGQDYCEYLNAALAIKNSLFKKSFKVLVTLLNNE